MNARPCRIPIVEQLTSLLLLEDGWYDGDGTAYSAAALIKASALLNALVSDVPMPYVYPTPENEVRAEWDVDDGAVVLTIDASITEATLRVMRDTTDGTEKLRCPVDDARLRARLLATFSPRPV